MLASSEELQRRRSPRDLLEFVQGVRDAVEANPAEMRDGILKRGLYKEFIDEILPLSQFAVVAYPATYSVEPVLGSQGYDAVVYDGAGRVFEHVEMTVPHDGAEDARDARKRVEHGIGIVHVGDPGSDIDEIARFVLKTCASKAEKDYSDATVVVVVRVLAAFAGFEKDYEEQVASLRARVAQVEFKARRVVLFFPPDRIEVVQSQRP